MASGIVANKGNRRHCKFCASVWDGLPAVPIYIVSFVTHWHPPAAQLNGARKRGTYRDSKSANLCISMIWFSVYVWLYVCNGSKYWAASHGVVQIPWRAMRFQKSRYVAFSQCIIDARSSNFVRINPTVCWSSQIPNTRSKNDHPLHHHNGFPLRYLSFSQNHVASTHIVAL